MYDPRKQDFTKKPLVFRLFLRYNSNILFFTR